MIIDTNGFEIGEEIYIARYIEAIKKYEVRSIRILSFKIYESGCYAINEYAHAKIRINNCYELYDDCQLACDRLNGINHD